MKKYVITAFLVVSFVSLLLLPSLANAQPIKSQERVKEQLNLTPEQEAKLKEFREARMEDRKAFREKMTKLRDEFQALMKDPKADEKKIDGLIDEMAKLRASQFKAGIKQRNEWKKIFTPEQLEKMEKFKGRMMERGAMRPGRFMPHQRFGMQRGFFGPRQFQRPGMRPSGFRMGMMNCMWWDW